MNIFVTSFNKLFTYNLLVYSWNSFKKSNYLYNFNEKNILPPISKLWLKKTAFLIGQGKFNYKLYFINSKTGSRSNLKLKIIENAFVFLISNYLSVSLNNNIDLIKYLRFNTSFSTHIFLPLKF